MTQAQATRTTRIVLFFIRLKADSLADTGKTGKQLDDRVYPQGEFKNRRKNRSRRGDEAELVFAQKSASSRQESMKFRLSLETQSHEPSHRAAFRNKFPCRAQSLQLRDDLPPIVAVWLSTTQTIGVVLGIANSDPLY